MADFYIKQGDTEPSIIAQLKDQNGDLYDLTGCTVKFHMRKGETATPKVNATATITDVGTDDVKVKYSWLVADVDTAGNFDIEWEITDTDGNVETVPNAGYDRVLITAQLT